MDTQLENISTPETAAEVENKTENKTENNPVGKLTWSNIKAFFQRNYAMFFAGILVFVLYVAQLVMSKVYPFGEYTVASYDLSAQICPFIEHLFDVLQGKSTLSYTYAIVGGADVTGTFLYFFVSPFSFLFLLFGDGKVAEAAILVMAAKLIAVAVSGCWFAKKLFNGIPDYICVAIGIVYAYCGYMFVSNTYINWVDFLIYMPFCVAAFKHFVKTGKFLAFSILVACCIYTCFSIACFSMFIAFPTLIAYGLICVEKERKNKFIAYLCLSFVVAVLLALPILLPALGSYINSARGGDEGLFYNLWTGYTDKDPNKAFNSSTYLKSFTTALYSKWAYVLSDSIFVVLTLVWFYRSRLRSAFSKFMLVAGIFTLLPVVFDEVMLLMNMGSYMSYAMRFGFLNAIYFLGGACLALEGICFKENHAYDGTPLYEETDMVAENTVVETETVQENATETVEETVEIIETVEETVEPVVAQTPKKEKKTSKTAVKIWSLVVLLLSVAAALFLWWFMSNNNYKEGEFWNWFFNSEEVSAIKGFSSKFAHSLGGTEVIAVFFIVVAIVAFFGCILVQHKKIAAEFLAYALVLVVGVQVLFYNNQLVVGNLSTQHQKLGGDYQTMARQLNEMDDSYFRVKDYGEVINKNGSSVRQDCWSLNAPFTGGTNSFSVFSSVIDKDNFVLTNLFGYLGNEKNTFKSTHNMGRNNRNEAFGDSFMGYKYFFVPYKQKETVEKLEYVEKVMVKDKDGEYVQDDNGGYVLYDSSNMSHIMKYRYTHLSMKRDSNSRYHYYVYENKIVFPSGYLVSSGEYRYEGDNGDQNDRLRNQNRLFEFLYGESPEDLGEKNVTTKLATQLSEHLWEKAADVDVGAGKITATVTNAKEGEYLMLNFVASKGYTVTVNGKPAELIDNDLKLLLVKLDGLQDGEAVVEFVYTSPYGKYALIGLATAIIGLCAVAFVVKRTRVMDFVAPVISYAGITLAVAVVAFFMLYPTCIGMVKILQLLLV
ncbi:MAG: YfhO family protein [Clostridia bacterium]|nr:YfhO family protein [Clostridia bacterium]